MSERVGFLTAADRTFLRGEKEYESKQGRYQRRKSIRERTRGAFLDFTLLYSELETVEREKIFEPIANGVYHPHAVPERGPEPPQEYREAAEFKDGLIHAFSFVYLGVWSTDIPFEELVEAAVFQTERDCLDRLVDVTLTIKEKDPLDAVESAIAKVESGSMTELNYTEMQLLMTLVMDPSEFGPADARKEALERLNALEPFSIPAVEDIESE